MIAVNGYIDGNTVVATDESLRNFKGDEIIIRIIKKPKTESEQKSVQQRQKPTAEERRAAVKAISGVLGLNKAMTIEDVREERLKERYGI